MKPYGIYLAFLYLITFFTIAVGGFMVIEGYTFGEAFYMVMITITTVGYGEVHPLSSGGRYFTVFLILLSFASLGVAGKKIAEVAVEGVFSGKKQLKKMNKKISNLKDHYILCGFGQVGQAVAEDLVRECLEFVVVNNEPIHTEEAGPEYLYHLGDATQEHVLEEAGIKKAKGLITMINSDPTNLYIVLTSRELNPLLHIVSRAEAQHSIKRIKQAGADQVISTYASVGQRITDVVLVHSGKGRQYKNRRAVPVPQWNQIADDSPMVGRTVMHLAKEVGKEILGLRQGSLDLIQPKETVSLKAGDAFLVLESPAKQPKEGSLPPGLNSHKVVLVDDNLAMLNLYVRLFKKAGFSPLTASDGEAGLQLIVQEKPEIAVVDCQLSKLTGIQICEKIRKIPELNSTKLIIFTSDERASTRERALAAGADGVIRKTPDAFHLIQEIINLHSDR